jgi:hypothetical protein
MCDVPSVALLHENVVKLVMRFVARVPPRGRLPLLETCACNEEIVLLAHVNKFVARPGARGTSMYAEYCSLSGTRCRPDFSIEVASNHHNGVPSHF